MTNPFLKKDQSEILIFDGAMGTEIYKHHFFVNTCFDQLCLTSPNVILEIHQSYADAGADVITTNSFGANRAKLVRHGLGEMTEKINRAAVDLARQVAGPSRYVAGSVGPLSELPQETTDQEAAEYLREQCQYLYEGGVDFVIFESYASIYDIQMALMAISSFPDKDYIMSFTVDSSEDSIKPEFLALLLQEIKKAKHPPFALGLNCGRGPEGILSGLENLLPLTDLPIIVQPNAGVPKPVDNRLIYMTSPEYFTTYAMRYVNLGARGVGGCCGTTAAHIMDVARSIRPLKKSQQQNKIIIQSIDIPEKPAIPMTEKSKLGIKIANREWISNIEMNSPRGFDLSSTIQKAKRCKEAGIDALNIPDGPRASSRLSPIITALEIQRQAEIEVILHCCCRDKNLIGMQADLLGCAAVGINNILFITGDPPKLGDYPFASAVFDVDSIGIVKIQNRLNHGIDLGGKPLDKPMRTLISVGADPNAIDMKREIRRLHEKIEAGAEFVITQPIFDPNALKVFLDMAQISVPVLAGIWPFASYRNAEFMKNEVPGVVVPDLIMKRMEKATSKEEQRLEGIAIAREIIEQIKDVINGVQVSAPLGNIETALAVTR